MGKFLQISTSIMALTVFLLMGLFSATFFSAYGQAQTIQSNYIRLQGGGGMSMAHDGDPLGEGVFPRNDASCGGYFRYNYSNSNRFLFFTGLAVHDPGNPDAFLPTMTQNNPNAGPSASAFTVGNVISASVTPCCIGNTFSNFIYHDRINSATGLPGADGVNDGYTGTATLNGFNIEHSAFIVPNLLMEDNRPDVINFLFTITNTTAQARVFGMSWNLDTQIGYGAAVQGGDLAPFFVPGLTKFKVSQLSVGFPVAVGSAAENRYMTQLLGGHGPMALPPLFSEGINPYVNDIPNYIYGLHPWCDVSGLIRTYLNNVEGHNWQKADYFAASHFAGGVSSSYYYGVNNGAPTTGSDDSGHMLRWNPRIIMPGETIRVGFSYGGSDAQNSPPDEISIINQLAPYTIATNDELTAYTNSPFTSESRVANMSSTSTLLSGYVVLKIPRAHLRIEHSMLQRANAWMRDPASDSDPQYDYYRYELPEILPFQSHILTPPVELFVLPKYVSDVHTQYWLILEDPKLSDSIAIYKSVQKKLFIPKLVCSTPQMPPPPPTLSHATQTSITLNAMADCEFRIDGGTWQVSTIFTDLMPNTTYNFETRKAEMEIRCASDPSEAVEFTTEALKVIESDFESIRIYPNPTKNELSVISSRLSVERIEIFNTFGKNVLSHKPLISSETTIDITDLPAGIYFIMITTEAGEVVKKLVKE